jgi:alpha-ketoglutarate-dependent taurine dioxygenase
MTIIKKIEYKGIQDIRLNSLKYKNKFIDDGILVFKNANLDYEDQVELHQELGNIFGWNALITGINTENVATLVEYTENHSHNKKITTAMGEDVLLDWHIEHCYYENPIVGATWNMVKFNIDNKNGQTYFVDTSEIYLKMPKEWQQILDKCFLSLPILTGNRFKIVKPHWITGLPVIRIIFNKSLLLKNINNFSDLNGTLLSGIEKHELIKIIDFIIEEVKVNKNNRKIQQWDKGDLVIPDMFKLAHAVSGGFNPEDREFIGMWGWQFPNRPELDISITTKTNVIRNID